ncbi:hypothetical protein TNCV_3660101 [Trichonephila clavipes]|nr:hypothetical protein TNCV_3660101 [Trichonephila clavipes]
MTSPPVIHCQFFELFGARQSTASNLASLWNYYAAHEPLLRDRKILPHATHSQTCCYRGSSMLLSWKHISQTVSQWLQCNVPFVVTDIPPQDCVPDWVCVLMRLNAFLAIGRMSLNNGMGLQKPLEHLQMGSKFMYRYVIMMQQFF